MKKTIGVFAHVDAGKTTFSEQLLFHTNAIRTRGRVDHKDAFLDTHDIEKRRGITIFSEQAYFTYKEQDYYLIDTPGHVDFSAEMERAIQIIDYAVIIISGIDGVQSHTETVYELLEKASIPVLFFINKLDAGHADFDQTFKSIQQLCSTAVDFSNDMLYENLAEYDEVLLDHFIEENFDEKVMTQQTIPLIKNREVMPVFKGSALQDEGIDTFLKALDRYTTTSYTESKLSGIVYKIRYDEKGVRQTFIKLQSGQLKVRDNIGDEKVTEIRKHQGVKYTTLPNVFAGDVFSVTGLDSLQVGDGFGNYPNQKFEMVPSLQSKVNYEASISPKDMYKTLKILEDEDPSLNVSFETSNKEMTIGIMGVIQLEILVEVMANRFGYDVSFEAPTIIYKETIKDAVIGYGHFEPLKHYAEVHLKIEAGEKDSGIIFENKCSPDHLPVGNQNLVKLHLFEKKHRGILTGSEITDIKVTLLTGRSHNQYTAGGDFREATLRALRQGLEQAENVLLEPIYEAKITVPMTDMGRLMTDIQQMHGRSGHPLQTDEYVTMIAHVPVSTFKDYGTVLASYTSGKGRMRLKVVGYDVCHNQADVIEDISYDKVTDEAYPSSSVFCTKGKGYKVSWEEAKAAMHCL